MPGFLHPSLLLCLTLLAPVAHAEGPSLDGSYTTSPEPPPTSEAPPNGGGPVENPDDAYYPPSPPPVVVLKPKESPRFTADEPGRLRRWLLELCREDAVSPDVADRVKFVRGGRVNLSAGNKQGTLVLLLDSYAEMAAYRDRCAEERKSHPEACRETGRLPKPGSAMELTRYPWMSFGSAKFWQDVSSGRTPAGIEKKTDLLNETQAQLKAIEVTFRKEFFNLRDAADIGETPESGAVAKKLAAMVRGQSTCGTRAVAEHAQK